MNFFEKLEFFCIVTISQIMIFFMIQGLKEVFRFSDDDLITIREAQSFIREAKGVLISREKEKGGN